jgi:uncharacterized protein (DUF2267 family)
MMEADMSATGLEVFDSTLQKTNVWLDDLMDALGTRNRRRAYDALRGTLHALRDRLPIDEAAQLAAQFPMLVRGFYYEGWDPTGKPLKIRDKESFLLRIEEAVPADSLPDSEEIARAVFSVLADHISSGEMEDVRHLLPKPLQELWPPTDAGGAGPSGRRTSGVA